MRKLEDIFKKPYLDMTPLAEAQKLVDDETGVGRSSFWVSDQY
jgi:hypothetical protein